MVYDKDESRGLKKGGGNVRNVTSRMNTRIELDTIIVG